VRHIYIYIYIYIYRERERERGRESLFKIMSSVFLYLNCLINFFTGEPIWLLNRVQSKSLTLVQRSARNV
jgi:hypothetical protein